MNKHKRIFLFPALTASVAILFFGVFATTVPVSHALIRLTIPPAPTISIDPTNNQRLTWATIDSPDPTYGLVYYNVYYKETSPTPAASWTQFSDSWGGTNLVKANLPFLLDRQLDPPNPSNYGKTAQFYVVACNYQKPEVKFNPESSFIQNGCSVPSNIQTIFFNSGDTYQPSYISGAIMVRINTPTTYSVTLYPDPNGGQVKAVFDWGDGTSGETQFINPSNNTSSQETYGTSVSLSHSWTTGGTYNIRVKAKDSYGLESAWQTYILNSGQNGGVSETPIIVDTQAPSVPAGVTAHDCATDTLHNCYPTNGPQINVAWEQSTDNGQVAGYKIYRNGSLLSDADSMTYDNFYPDASAVPGTSYTYAVAAVDVVGNTSTKSAPVSAMIALPDTQAPAAPKLTLGDIFSTQINISWNVPADNVGVVGYKIFRNGELIDTTVETHYNDHNQNLPAYYTILEPSTTYSYKVAAYDAAQNLSPQSNAVSAKTLGVNDTTIPPPDTTVDDNGTSTPPVVQPQGTSTPPIVLPQGTSTPPVVPPTLDTKNDNGTSTPPVVPKEKEKTTKNKDQVTKDKTTKDKDQQSKDKSMTLRFTRDLQVSSKGDDVKALQQILINEGVFPKGKVTGTFDSKTKAAVVKFQNKYKSEILTPMRLKRGNGIVGATTRAKLNAIYNLSVVGPTIFSLSPSSGPVGSKFTITGTGFTPTGNKVEFGTLGVEGDPSNNNPSTDGNTITFLVPSGNYLACWRSRPACQAPAYSTQPGTYDVSVINANGTSQPKTFTVTK